LVPSAKPRPAIAKKPQLWAIIKVPSRVKKPRNVCVADFMLLQRRHIQENYSFAQMILGTEVSCVAD
jgi:hypothetical protein